MPHGCHFLLLSFQKVPRCFVHAVPVCVALKETCIRSCGFQPQSHRRTLTKVVQDAERPGPRRAVTSFPDLRPRVQDPYATTQLH